MPTAFLYREVKQDIYIKQPEGNDDGNNHVFRLERIQTMAQNKLVGLGIINSTI